MLEDPAYTSIVRWSDTGDSFVVLDTNEFTKAILPRHFKHSNFASFVRQLNKYDFHKIRANETGTAYGENAWQFKHPDFQMNKKCQIDLIRRKTTGAARKKKGTVSGDSNGGGANNNNSTDNGNLGMNGGNGMGGRELAGRPGSGGGGGGGSDGSVSEYVKALEAEASAMKSELNHLKAEVLEFKTMAASLQSSLSVLHESHSVTLHKLTTLQNVSKVSNEVLRKLLVMETSRAPAHEKHVHVLDMLQHLNTSESTRNDVPVGINGLNGLSSDIGVTGVGLGLGLGLGLAGGLPNSSRHMDPGKDTPTDFDTSVLKRGAHSHTPSPPLTAYAARVLYSRSGAQPASRFTVLLVDDDDVSVRKIRKILQEYGCDVDVANDGVDAWRRAEANTYDLVLLSLVIPSLDGISVAAQMRKLDVACPIVVMAAQKGPGSAEQCRVNGISEIVVKPFEKEALTLLLNKYLGVGPRRTESNETEPNLGGVDSYGSVQRSRVSHITHNNNNNNNNNNNSSMVSLPPPPPPPLHSHPHHAGSSPHGGYRSVHALVPLADSEVGAKRARLY